MALVNYDNSSDEDVLPEGCSASVNDNENIHTEFEKNAYKESLLDTNVNYFGLESDSDSDNYGVDNSHSFGNKKSFKTTSSSIHHNTEKADFWLGETSEDWLHPETIWQSTNADKDCNNSSIVAINQNLANTKGVKRVFLIDADNYESKSKKFKCDQHITSKESHYNKTTNEKKLLLKRLPLFYVHHKIAPFVNQASPACRPSKNKLLDIHDAHSGVVNRVQWCCKQYSHLLASASMDKSVKVWNIFSKQTLLMQSFSSHEKAVRDVQWSANGRDILTASFDKTARLFDVETGKEKQCLTHPNYVTCSRFHPVNPHLTITGSINCLFCWDIRCSKQPTKQYRHKDSFGQVNDVVFMHHGTEFFTSTDLATRDSADRNIMAWDFATGAVLSNQIYHERYTCPRLQIHPNGLELYAQSQGNYIAAFSTIRPYKMNKCKRYEMHKFWNEKRTELSELYPLAVRMLLVSTSSAPVERVFVEVEGYPVGFDVSFDGQLLVSGSTDSRLVFYDTHLAKMVKQLQFEDKVICTDVAWHPLLYSTIASSTWDGAIIIWQ